MRGTEHARTHSRRRGLCDHRERFLRPRRAAGPLGARGLPLLREHRPSRGRPEVLPDERDRLAARLREAAGSIGSW